MTPVFVGMLATALAAAVLTTGVIFYARRKGLVDQPGERRSHAVATPRGGGLAIVLVVAVGLAGVAWLESSRFAVITLAGLAVVAWVGWLDDHRDLSIRVRLLAHAGAAGLLAWGSGQGPLGMACIVALTVVLINVWNFMDGINGLATSQAMVFAGTAAWILPWREPGLLALALLGACIGFLPFNFPKARIFLGDVGSGALGFLIAAIVAYGARGGIMPFGHWALWFPLAPFMVDAGWTLLARMYNGEAWWRPHVTHAYQRLARQHGHAPVTLGYLCVALAGSAFAGWCTAREMEFIKISLSVWYISLSIAWWVLRKQRFARAS